MPGASSTNEPTDAAAGQALAANCSFVHACSPLAAAGFRVMPSGSATCTLCTSGEFGFDGSAVDCGTCNSALMPSGWSDWLVSGVSDSDGLKASEPQPLAATGVSFS